MKCSRCGAEVKEGTKFCTRCGGNMEDGIFARPDAAAPPSAPETRFGHDKYLFNQKKFSIREMYYIFDEKGNEIFFARRVFLALRRHVYIYMEREQKNLALTIIQEKFWAIFNLWFTLQDHNGQPVCRFHRRNLMSILRRSWDVVAMDGTLLCQVIEDSWGKAIIRRFVPYGELLKTDFDFIIGGGVAGRYIRKWTLFDKYVLDLTMDSRRALDRRIAIAMGVLLDAAERR
jgi:uncharacterized protein YxjI